MVARWEGSMDAVMKTRPQQSRSVERLACSIEEAAEITSL